jgi:hypothetical protein
MILSYDTQKAYNSSDEDEVETENPNTCNSVPKEKSMIDN